MALMKSPGGSIFPYFYKNGELHCLKYGSFYADEVSLFRLMEAEEAFLLKQPKRLPVWVDLYKTALTPQVLHALLANLEAVQNRIVRLALVGMSRGDKRKWERLLRERECVFSFPLSYYSDPEAAKTWLVGE